MKKYTIQVYVIGTKEVRKPGDIGPPAWGVHLPTGSRILDVIKLHGPKGEPAMGVSALSPINNPVVWTPLFIGQMDDIFDPPIGRKVGQYIGSTPDNKGLPICVFADEPTSGLVGMEAAGNG